MRRCDVAVQKDGCLCVYRMFLHEVKAGGSFLKGTQSRGLVIIDHMVPGVQQRLEMKQQLFFSVAQFPQLTCFVLM